MGSLDIQVLGGLSLRRDGEPVSLPASRKTRALLAYLVVTTRPHRRDRLCELLWEIPDDPRAALRWSLSKLRSIVNDPQFDRIIADRERAEFAPHEAEVDLHRIRHLLTSETASDDISRLHSLEEALREPLLDGVDLPEQPEFQQWLEAERALTRRLRAQAAALLTQHDETPADQALEFAELWLELDPYSHPAASAAVTALHRLGRSEQAAALTQTLIARHKTAGTPWTAPASAPATRAPTQDPAPVPTADDYLKQQSVHFCTAKDGVHIAYATVGKGSTVVKAANWLSHLELDWDAPIWSPLFRRLARHHRFVRYDERGNGLSDWEVDNIDFDAFVTDLETVVDALELDKFALLGISQGASVSIEYAVRHPERVSHLILFGGYPAGWRVEADETLVREREALLTLTETGWGRDLPAYRQVFSTTFMPSADPDELAWFNEFQRQTTSPRNAVRFMSAFGDIDVRHRLAQVQVPTLVLHSRGDQRIPFSVGRELATRIPGARLVGLESDSHLLLGRDPASHVFVDAIQRFLAEPTDT